MASDVENRVINLEAVLAEFISSTSLALTSLSNEMKDFKDEMREFKDEMKEFKDEMKEFKDEMKEFKDEMKEFKDEMRDFKDEMKEFKDEMREFKDEMKEFKDEMKEFKDEMKEFKDEMKEFGQDSLDFKAETLKYRKEMNQQWGGLANRLGTLVEDIFLPGIRPTLQKYFNADIDFSGIRVHKKIKDLGLEGEFDLIATDEKRVYLIEVKSTPATEKFLKFKNEALPRFRKLYPEWKDKELIPIFGSLYFTEDLIQQASELGIYLMGYREWEYLDLLNFEEVRS